MSRGVSSRVGYQDRRKLQRLSKAYHLSSSSRGGGSRRRQSKGGMSMQGPGMGSMGHGPLPPVQSSSAHQVSKSFSTTPGQPFIKDPVRSRPPRYRAYPWSWGVFRFRFSHSDFMCKTYY